jgi:hypothetical protein
MRNHIKIAAQVKKIVDTKGVLSATETMLKKYKIFPKNLELAIKPTDAVKQLVVTTEGDFGRDLQQIVRVPENLFDFPMEMVVNMLAHEMLHINQKTGDEPVTDKNEREFQAYYEGVFPEFFTDLPTSPNWLKKQLAKQAIRYFTQMGDGSELQAKYLEKKQKLEDFLETIT